MNGRRAFLSAAVGGLLMASVALNGAAQTPVEFSLALTGDSIITRKLAVYSEPAFLRVMLQPHCA